jgi:long-chain acyl-CoA synthetase
MTGAQPTTLPAWLAEQARRRAHAPALHGKQLGAWRSLRWDQVAAHTRALAAGLVRRGFGQGDALLLAAPPSERAVLLSLAVQWLGGIAVPLEPSLGDTALARIVGHLSPRFALADDDTTLDRLRLLGVPVIDGNPRGLKAHPDPAVVGFDTVWTEGGHALAEDPDTLSEPRALADDDAFIFVDARGEHELVTQHLRHASLIEDAHAVVAREGLDEHEEAFAARAFSASAQARYLIAPWLVAGFSIYFPEGLATRDNDRREIAPTLVAGTRETYARVAAIVRERLPASGWQRKRVDAALRGTGGPLLRALAWWLVARPLREVIGFARTRVALVVGAPLDASTRSLFTLLRIDVHAWPDASDWRQVSAFTASGVHEFGNPLIDSTRDSTRDLARARADEPRIDFGRVPS